MTDLSLSDRQREVVEQLQDWLVKYAQRVREGKERWSGHEALALLRSLGEDVVLVSDNQNPPPIAWSGPEGQVPPRIYTKYQQSGFRRVEPLLPPEPEAKP